MSRIDNPRSTASVSVGGGGQRIVLGTRNADGSPAQVPVSAGAPRQDFGFDTRFRPRAESTMVLSPMNIQPQDTAALANLPTDQLIAQLGRIEAVLSELLAREEDSGAKQSYAVGQAALGDVTRRLNLLSAGYSSLVVKW